ncbi:hypothetical protein VNO78_31651 [Psophocarpus tetragonolobus]|uniref:mannosyl-glycoprotein endo-beta-N-acetylglucosaminidase n=1 Tax=Psophocarpus tetragonolobus TaxID=3891 RepID=A0AAN9RZ83_PSOTE
MRRPLLLLVWLPVLSGMDMGVSVWVQERGGESEFDPKQPSEPISYPIKTLKELESRSCFDSFHYPFNTASVPIESGYSASLPKRRRILVCHDMAGGYLDDKWVQGGTNAEAYAIWHWHLLDVFVYFSHYLVTLPPPSWTNTAHRHGVKVLGTFITEGEEGRAVCDKLLSTKESAQIYAKHLAELAANLGFDGWLLNMEVSLKQENISNLKEFVNHLSLTMHSSVPGSLVIWYDSITINGDLEWQNQDYPKRSAAVAGDRKFDVYMGIDVFGRNTYGGGQWNTNVALDVITKEDVSAAIFAPGWVYETKQAPDFETAQNRYLCILTTYADMVILCYVQGRGYHISVDGDQPLLEFADSTTNPVQLLVDLKETSDSGGGNITFKGSLEKDTYFKRRIFQGEFILNDSPIHFLYSVNSDSNSSLGLVLEFTSINKTMCILLTSHGMDHLSSRFSKVVPTSEPKGNTPGWVIHEGTIEMNGYILTEIHALCYRSNAPPCKELGLKYRPFGPDHTMASSTDYFAVLGHITVKTSNYKPNFPVSTSWLVDGGYINWKSGPQDSRILSVKVSWKMKEGNNFVFSHYNVYVETLSKLEDGNLSISKQVQEYLGVAHVNCFYISELKIPPFTSSLKFIIQVCSFDGTNQNLEECPYYQLEIKDL